MLFWIPPFKQFTSLLSCFFCFCIFCLMLCSYFVVALCSYIIDQLGAYHNSRVQCTQPVSTLTCWDEQETLYPLCNIIAKYTLYVPASSATSERSFSKIGRIIKSRRRGLGDAHVQERRFISWNANLLES